MPNLLELPEAAWGGRWSGLDGWAPALPQLTLAAPHAPAPDLWLLAGDSPNGELPLNVAQAVDRLRGVDTGQLIAGPALLSDGAWVMVARPDVAGGGPLGYRRAGQAAARAGRALGAMRWRALAPDAACMSALLEGIRQGWYRYPRDEQPPAPLVEVFAVAGLDARSLEAAALASQANVLTRLWVEAPPNRLTPEDFAAQAVALASRVGLSAEILGPEEIATQQLGGVLAVGSGSRHLPRIVVLRHRPEQTPELGLVGKGITFDSGGISIKPAANLRKLKGDKAGAAAVLAASLAAAQADCPMPFVAVLPLAENLPDGDAYRPGDVVTLADGSTADIVSTDAEGRLVLADGLTLARRAGAKRLLTLATLTRAAIVALGYFRGALFSSDQRLQHSLLAAGERSGERLWPMPVDDDYARLLHSPVADALPSSELAGGGAIVAAKFIQRFTGGQPWAHIDMSSIFYFDMDLPWSNKGYTGSGGSLLFHWLMGQH